MKRAAVLPLAILLVLTACGGKDTAARGTTDNQNAVTQIMESAAQSPADEPPLPVSDVPPLGERASGGDAPAADAQTDAAQVLAEPEHGADGIDIDLTQMNATMVFAEVSSIMYMPDDYLGKIIRMKGTAVSSADPDTGAVYHAVIIQDATACCASGLEYILAEGEYPPDETEVTVTGEFGLYEEGGIFYCQLTDAVLDA